LVGLVVGVFLLTRGDITGTALALIDRMTGRSISIRARVEHEWPFAWHIFKQHPWLGGGEGAFARLVGPLVRTRQLTDPMLLNADNNYWESQAHNELLETLCSLGIP